MMNDKGEMVGPLRVWKKNENVPGLGMSRSFGDKIGFQCGVIAKPEIMEWVLSEEDKFIILASDGIWEFMDSEEVVSLVKDSYISNNIQVAAENLVLESSKRWKQKEGVIDDITLILIFFED